MADGTSVVADGWVFFFWNFILKFLHSSYKGPGSRYFSIDGSLLRTMRKLWIHCQKHALFIWEFVSLKVKGEGFTFTFVASNLLEGISSSFNLSTCLFLSQHVSFLPPPLWKEETGPPIWVFSCFSRLLFCFRDKNSWNIKCFSFTNYLLLGIHV